ncbi:MAG TPA: hypothetical protein VF600_00955 [Abditibacteriaceae bacterium]
MLRRLLLTLLLIVPATTSYAQKDEYGRPLTQRPEITDWGWTKHSWTGDESPYVRIGRSIDVAISKGQSSDALVKKLRASALAKPTDPKAQYAWGYAALVARPAGYAISRNEVQGIALALARPAFPRTYQYARLRFVSTMQWRPYMQLKGLGQRLLGRKSNDYNVKYYLTKLLSIGSAAERQQALTYAQQLVREQPNRASAYWSLGGVYVDILWDSNNLSAGDKAIAAYRRYIQLSQDSQSRRSAERLITLIQREQAKLRKRT